MGTPTSIGKNIKRIRKARDLTQAEFAEIVGVTDKSVSSWELGNSTPRPEAVESIAAHFHLTVSDLYMDDPDEVCRVMEKEEAFLRPGMSDLFDAAKNVPEEDVRMVTEILHKMKKPESE